MTVLIVGISGMLGRHVFRHVSSLGIPTIVTQRTDAIRGIGDSSRFKIFDVEKHSVVDLVQELGEGDVVVNCAGVVKSLISDNDHRAVKRALEVNSLFPLKLADQAESKGFKVIQIATDCVFSGKTGDYSELSPHDPIDAYGKTKSLGEPVSPQVLNVRCSIIGRENGRQRSLVEWVASRPRNAVLDGYVNHEWNGVTADAFGKLVAWLVIQNFSGGTAHFVPANQVTKSELVRLIADRLDRGDLKIEPTENQSPINRTLKTLDPSRNSTFWRGIDFPAPPTVQDLVHAMPISLPEN